MRRLTTTTVWLLLVMIGVGPAFTMLAQATDATPGATPVSAESDWQIADRRKIDVDGQPVMLSPDGQWIAGTGPNGAAICVWEIESLAPTCAGDDVRPDEFSIAWAPDSSAIAFTDGSILEAGREPNTLWLYSVADETLTARAGEAVSGDVTTEATLVGSPVWTPDSQQVLFQRSPAGNASSLQNTIVVADIASGDLEQVSLPAGNYAAPVVPTDDGRILFYVASGDVAASTGIWQAGLDGTGMEQLLAAADVPKLVLVQIGSLAVDQRSLVVWTLDAAQTREDWSPPAPFLLDLMTGELQPVTPADGSRVLWNPIPFLDDGSTGAVLTYDDGDDAVYLQMLDSQTGEIRPVAGGAIELWEEYWFVSWEADDQLLIATDIETVLLTLEHDE